MRRARNKHTRGHSGFFVRHRRMFVIASVSLIGVFVVANAGLALFYSSRTYPGTKVMDAAIGSVAYDSLSQKVGELKLLPQEVTLTKNGQKTKVSLAELGISKNTDLTVKSAKEQRAFLPIVNLFKSPRLEAPVNINDEQLSTKAAQLATIIKADPVTARLEINGTDVTIIKEKDGYTFDQKKFKQALQHALNKGESTLGAPVQTTKAQTVAADLDTEKTMIESQLQTPITFKYQSRTKQPSKADVASWYSPSGSTYAVAHDKLTAYLALLGSEFGIRIKDTGSVVVAVVNALKSSKASTVNITAQTAVKTYTYCTGVRGVDASQLTTLRNKLKSTYADSRGWSLGGLVEFKEATTGCDFTVWLSASSQMTSFGGVCDPIWSCRSGDNVVFNYDRWTGASDAWNQYGGSLEDYRSMLINHETGHRLGFGHRYCGGAGQLAPVMQQQSISLGGCKFNPWPIQAELGSFRTALGL